MKLNKLIIPILLYSTSAIASHSGLFFGVKVNGLPKVWPFNAADSGNLTITSNTSIAGGRTLVYNNLTINAGVTLTILAANNSIPTIIGVKGTFTNNGTIVANNSTYTGTISSTAPDGTSLSYNILQAQGGYGGNEGGTSAFGGSGAGGYGGGGAGGSTLYSGTTYYVGTNGYSNNGSSGGSHTGGNGNPGSGTSGGIGGGSEGGSGSTYSVESSGGGGGGGNKSNSHGQALYIRTNILAGSGSLILTGGNGFNGGAGADSSYVYSGYQPMGGGGGGGGAGGSGGYYLLKYLTGTYSGSCNPARGNPGVGGPGGAGYQNGAAGASGNYGANGSCSALHQ
jgi:hypothetical protein